MTAGRTIRLDIPVVTPLLNATLRQHWRKRGQGTRGIAWELRLAMSRAGVTPPAKPFQRARVTIIRRSVGMPDRDGLIGGVKGLVDSLLDPGIRMVKGELRALHPTGLGIVQDDSPACMTLEVRAERVRSRAEQGTTVIIEDLGRDEMLGALLEDGHAGATP